MIIEAFWVAFVAGVVVASVLSFLAILGGFYLIDHCERRRKGQK